MFYLSSKLAWERFEVLASRWAFYEFDRKVRIRFFKALKNNTGRLISSLETTLQTILQKNDGGTFPLRCENSKNIGVLRINNVLT